MRKNFMMTLLGLACVVSFGLAALPSRAQEAAPAPEYMDMEAQTAAASCYDNGGTVDCGDCGTCDSCVGCGGCYGGCGGCYGGCGLGILPFVHDVAAVALTPARWVAGLLSCGTFADCGCAPRPCRTYCDPCDSCGNWVGGCSYCGGVGCTACAGNRSVAAVSAPSTSSDYLNYNNIETIHQQKTRQMNAAPAAEEIPQEYIYNEETVKGASRPTTMPKKAAVRPNNTARPVKKSAANPQPTRSNSQSAATQNRTAAQPVYVR